MNLDRTGDDVPNIKSAKKRLRQSEERHRRNKAVRSEIRTRMRRILSLESEEEARAEMDRLQAVLDRAAARRVIHPNAAARKKSQAARHVAELAGS